MPFFRYSALDAKGKLLEGQIQAASPDAARIALQDAGLRIRLLNGQAQTATPTNTRDAKPKPLAIQTARPPTIATIRTRRVGDKHRFMLFSQLGRFMRSGIAANSAFHQLATQTTVKPLQDALFAAEKAATAGQPVSNAFEQYPDVFPPDVVATYRAGETGGFLGEACDEISGQAEISHRIKKVMVFYGAILVSLVALFPLSLGVINGALQSVDAQDKAGGTLSPVGTLLLGVRDQLLKIAPAAALAFLVMYIAYRVWNAMPNRLDRHKLVLTIPILAGRAKAESLARFGWVIASLSKGGAPAYVCLQMAARSMPNLEMARRMMETAGAMKENEKLSTALRRTNLLDPQFKDVVENGELTGDVPGAVMNMARATHTDFEARDKSFMHMSAMLFYVPLGILCLGLLVVLYKTWYGGLITKLTVD